jgi:hypothetical protein
MTIPATSRVSPIYQGNASATTFAFAYKTYAKQELQVIISDGVTPQTLVLDSDYSVALNADQVNTPGGSVTYPLSGSPLPAGFSLVVVSNVPNSQDASIPTGGAFNASIVELGFDRQQVQLQQFNDTLNRTIRVPVGESISAPLPAALTRANYLLGFDGLGNPVAVVPVNGSAASLATDLTSTAVASKGAGQVGFLYSLGYAAGTIGRWLKDLALGTGAWLIGYSQASGNTGGTVGGRLAQDISVLDLKYMTLAQIVDVVSYTGAMDVTACIQAALNDIANTVWLGASGPTAYAKGGGKVYLPPGKWNITDTLKVGNNTELYGASAFGGTAPSITTNTGTVISCNFTSNQKRWAISSATYTAPSGVFATFNQQYTGTDHDSGLMTLCFGIKVRNLTINGNGAYGGVRLMGGAGFDVQNVFAYSVGVGFLFNTSYGARYGNLRAQHSLYGMVISNCTAMECGHFYADKTATTWSNVAADTTTRLVSTFDMSASAFLPADWSNKSYGLYVSGCIDMTMTAQTCEHSDVGSAFAHVSDLLLTGYFEGNGDSDCTFVASTGQATVFANATTSGFKYHFGTLNNVTLESCSVGAIYMGETTTNKVRVSGADSAGSGTSDWTWSDVIDFQDVGNVLRVSATGTTTAVLGYTTLDEALRRISVSRADKRAWVINVKDGDTVSTAAQRTIAGKDILIQRDNTGASKPIVSAGAAGGGFIYRISFNGACRLSILNVDMAFPAAAAAASDNALFNTAGACELAFTAENANVGLGNGYSLFGTFANTAMLLNASWATCGITASTPAALLRNSGSALISSIQANTTMLAGIKAIGTNGWQGTVLSSNFA